MTQSKYLIRLTTLILASCLIFDSAFAAPMGPAGSVPVQAAVSWTFQAQALAPVAAQSSGISATAPVERSIEASSRFRTAAQWPLTQWLWRRTPARRIFRVEHRFTAFFEEIFVPIVLPVLVCVLLYGRHDILSRPFLDRLNVWLLVYRSPFYLMHWIGPRRLAPRNSFAKVYVRVMTGIPLAAYAVLYTAMIPPRIAIPIGVLFSYVYHAYMNRRQASLNADDSWFRVVDAKPLGALPGRWKRWVPKPPAGIQYPERRRPVEVPRMDAFGGVHFEHPGASTKERQESWRRYDVRLKHGRQAHILADYQDLAFSQAEEGFLKDMEDDRGAPALYATASPRPELSHYGAAGSRLIVLPGRDAAYVALFEESHGSLSDDILRAVFLEEMVEEARERDPWKREGQFPPEQLGDIGISAIDRTLRKLNIKPGLETFEELALALAPLNDMTEDGIRDHFRAVQLALDHKHLEMIAATVKEIRATHPEADLWIRVSPDHLLALAPAGSEAAAWARNVWAVTKLSRADTEYIQPVIDVLDSVLSNGDEPADDAQSPTPEQPSVSPASAASAPRVWPLGSNLAANVIVFALFALFGIYRRLNPLLLLAAYYVAVTVVRSLLAIIVGLILRERQKTDPLSPGDREVRDALEKYRKRLERFQGKAEPPRLDQWLEDAVSSTLMSFLFSLVREVYGNQRDRVMMVVNAIIAFLERKKFEDEELARASWEILPPKIASALIALADRASLAVIFSDVPEPERPQGPGKGTEGSA